MERWNTAGYLRLSREDGDKAESDSIANQRKLLAQYLDDHPELRLVSFYQDDGYTGTNFDRPAFRRMEADIALGRINCVLVKDLSRFGRDYIEVGRYLERVFPAAGVRFIAVGDQVDSLQGRYDMLLPIRNLFNTQYARDISDKVRSAIRAKQQRGEFVGAFACYGYRKDPADHSRLLIDPPAARVVQRIFTLFEQGYGKIRIAKLLNAEGVPSPSMYKELMGERYHNGRRLSQTVYWTYATIHRILQNRMYAGDMEQGRSFRPVMHGGARQRDRKDWTVVPRTHEAVIGREQWERVQALLARRARQPSFGQPLSPFAGFLRCGDCGRAMVRTSRSGKIVYTCGSYRRYGPAACSPHSVPQSLLEAVILEDLNRFLASVPDCQRLAAEAAPARTVPGERERLEGALERVRRLKKSLYEDYRDRLVSREDFLRYQADYTRQEESLAGLRAELARRAGEASPTCPWIQALAERGELTELDRATVAEAVRQILVFEGNRLEITYAFAGSQTLPAEQTVRLSAPRPAAEPAD